jgi:hypothetical protein
LKVRRCDLASAQTEASEQQHDGTVSMFSGEYKRGPCLQALIVNPNSFEGAAFTFVFEFYALRPKAVGPRSCSFQDDPTDNLAAVALAPGSPLDDFSPEAR